MTYQPGNGLRRRRGVRSPWRLPSLLAVAVAFTAGGVEYLGLREVQVGFRVTCATERYDGTIRTWDLDLSGIILCGLDQSDMLARQAEGYCDWS